MPADKKLEDRLRAIEDKLDILNLIASHPPCSDTGSDHFVRTMYMDDGVIDLGDAGMIGANYKLAVPPGPASNDFNADGTINLLDLVLVG